MLDYDEWSGHVSHRRGALAAAGGVWLGFDGMGLLGAENKEAIH
jgi:hypothetical protein